MIPTLISIDHIHLSVGDRALAEKWYKDVLGFTRIISLERWAVDGGPLTIASASGNIHLALFENAEVQSTIVAFNVGSEEFFEWMAHLDRKGIFVKEVDHDLSWSIYFKDLDGNPFEITTYEYDRVKEKLEKLSV